MVRIVHEYIWHITFYIYSKLSFMVHTFKLQINIAKFKDYISYS